MWLSRMETQNLCFNEIKTLNLRGVLCFCMIKLGKCTMSHCQWQWKWRYSQRILSRVRNGTGFSIPPPPASSRFRGAQKFLIPFPFHFCHSFPVWFRGIRGTGWIPPFFLTLDIKSYVSKSETRLDFSSHGTIQFFLKMYVYQHKICIMQFPTFSLYEEGLTRKEHCYFLK